CGAAGAADRVQVSLREADALFLCLAQDLGRLRVWRDAQHEVALGSCRGAPRCGAARGTPSGCRPGWRLALALALALRGRADLVHVRLSDRDAVLLGFLDHLLCAQVARKTE